MKIGPEKQPETESKKESSFEIFKKAEKAS